MSRDKKAQRQRQQQRALQQPTEKPSPSQTFRIVVEKSCMSNNDEYIYYTQKAYTTPEAVDALRKSLYQIKDSLGQPTRLVICRPVFAEEIRDELDITFKGSTWDDKYHDPDITHFIDSCYRMRDHLEFRKKYNLHCSLSSWLAYYAGNTYYDCMSGGCPQMDLVFLKYLCSQPGIDLDEKVYPASSDDQKEVDKWHTLKDFLHAIKNIEELDEVITRLKFTKKLLPLEAFVG